jgi:hypothetical protein
VGKAEPPGDRLHLAVSTQSLFARSVINRSRFIGLLLLLSAPLLAQPVAPTPQELAALRTAECPEPPRAAAAVPFSVNVSSREAVRQFYRTVYFASENVPMGWTGSYSVNGAGDTSATYKEAVLRRINFYRAFAGVPATMTLRADWSAKDQQAALMMSANNALNHTPPPSWTFYTADGAEAAGKSNIAIGSAGPDAITLYMADHGTSNAAVGHRRWLLYPQTKETGTGDVPGNSSGLLEANATWVITSDFGTTRPATRTTAVPYPPAGYVPYTLVWPRWSFSYPDANFSNATVTMTRNGQSISAVAEPLSAGAGEPTLVWVYDGKDSDSHAPHARPTADTVYHVTIANVTVAGASQTFSYDVTVFDPDVAGNDFAAVAVSGSATPAVGASSTYTVAVPNFAGRFDWRTVPVGAFSKTYDAESGLDGITATTNSDYSVVQSTVAGASGGASSYHLAHTSRTDQILLLPETFLVGATSPAVTFRSRLGWASDIQSAHVQVSTDDGATWLDVYSQSGTNSGGETSFTSRSASLAAYANRTVRVRFVYAVELSGSAYPQSTSGIGWYLDNITLAGVQKATPATAAAAAAGANSFTYTPGVTGVVGLQARGVLFDSYPMEWGPVTTVTAANAVSVTTQPTNQASAAGGSTSFTVAAAGTATYQWQYNGATLTGATSGTLALANVQPASTGIYTAQITSGGVTVPSRAAILGVSSAVKLVGSGREFADIFHAGTGFTYDQILLEGAAASVTADPGQILRMSFIDLNDDIVQVEFSGAGTLSLVLDGVTGPATPQKYNQATSYMKGHAGIVLSGADDNTNLSVFSVGRANATNQALFRSEVTYDGFADIAFIAITSTNGKFGGLRTANASYFATKGYTGVYAPNVEFIGPVFVGDIRAENEATPVLVIGSGTDTRITGGDLLQTNGRAVQVSGLTQLKFAAGSNSHGTLFPAQTNRARLEQNGADVTAAVVAP